MKYFKINAQNPDTKIIKEAVRCLNKGGLIIYPTDTLYGVGVDVYNRKAVNKLFLVKRRDMRRPVSIMLSSLQQIKEIFGFSPSHIKEDIEKIMPGRCTAIINNAFQKKIPIFENVDNPGSYIEKVGIRIPSNPASSALAYLFDSPISCTSANISGKENTFSIENIIAQFGNVIDLILDAGPIPFSKGSTIIDFTRDPYFILRDGDVSEKKLISLFGRNKITRRKNKFVITFVCSGNICRSPMAEALLKKMLKSTKYKHIVDVLSAGTLSIPISSAHDYAIRICDENGIDVTRHFSQPINDELVRSSDIIFCMAQNHYSYIINQFPEYKNKVVLLKQWKSSKEISIPSVADPIGHDFSFFKSTYQEIHTELKRTLPFILNEIKKFIKLHELQTPD